jgi:outer membrane receptor protein involved in Fe transport
MLQFFSCASAPAQVSTSGLTGSVSDSSGGVVPNAEITLTNTATGVARQTVTNGEGVYNFDYVPIGTYDVGVHAQGFQDQAQHGIQLQVAQTARADFAVSVGNATSTVVVNAATQALNTTSPEQTSTLSATGLNQLPVAKQDWTSVLLLGAGISTTLTGNSPAGASLTINGLPPAGFNLTVDGTNATSDPETPAFGFYQGPNIINTINNDAIAEVSIVKGIAPATIGGTMSGNVNIVTKTGTNRFHGSLYEINDVSAYDARNQFLTTKPRSTFNEFGGSVGGPIIPSKLFFFGSYEGARVSSFSAISGTVPTPYLVRQSPAVFAPIFNAYPKVSQPANDPTALTTQFFGSGSLRQTDGNSVARIDYNPTENDLIYARYIRGRPTKLSPNVVLTNPRNTTGHTDAANAAYTHSAHSWTSLTRFGYNRIRLTRLDEGFASDLEEVIFAGFDSNGAEQFVKSGDFWSGEEEIALTRGKHSIDFGGIIQRQDAGRTDYNTATLQYSSLNDFLNNTPSRSQITFDLTPFNLYSTQYGLYVQDDYSVMKNLTLNLGIRYDYFTVPKEDNNRVFNRGVDPTNASLGPGFGPYRPADSMYHAHYNNFQPRAGFNYGLNDRQSTLLRGGFGIFVSPHPIFGGPIDMVQDSASTPFRIALNSQQNQSAGIRYPLPRTSYEDVLKQLQASGTISTNLANTSINADFPNPYSMQWMLGVEQALPGDIAVEIDYVGNRGLKENMTETRNLPDRVTGVAPDPTFSQFRYYYGGDSSNYNGLQIQVNRSMKNGVSFGGSYVWSKAMSFAQANLLLQAQPQDNDNIQADYGPAPFDVQHVFVGHGLWELPLNQWMHLDNRASRLAFGGWQITGIFTSQTGLPANLLNTNSSYPSDRPDSVAGVSHYLSGYQSTRQYLNPAAFAMVPISSASGAQIRGGDLGRDAVRLPGIINLDAGLSKTFGITESVHFQLKADAFNVLNHTNLTNLVTSVNSGSFGQLTSATARTMQLTGRLTF